MNVTQLTDSDKNTTLLTHFVTINTCYIYFNINISSFQCLCLRWHFELTIKKPFRLYLDLITRTLLDHLIVLKFIPYFKLFQITNIVYRPWHNMTGNAKFCERGCSQRLSFNKMWLERYLDQTSSWSKNNMYNSPKLKKSKKVLSLYREERTI